MNNTYKLGFIGAGNMAKAIASGLIDSNILSKDQILMSNISSINEYKGIKIVKDNGIILSQCENFVIAVKPQIFNEISSTFINCNAKCIISIMAGITISKIKASFPHVKNIVRVMPNTPSAVALGMSCISHNGVDDDCLNFAKTIFESIGKVEFIEEKLFDAVTSVSGSGPAYVYYFIKSMIDGGIAGGLTYEQSKKLTLQTIIGACKMVEKKDEDLSDLIKKVCSKGGTTIQAIDTFTDANLDKIIIEGINKCRKRSEELSK